MDKIGTVLILLGFMFEDPKHLFISRKKNLKEGKKDCYGY